MRPYVTTSVSEIHYAAQRATWCVSVAVAVSVSVSVSVCIMYGFTAYTRAVGVGRRK